MGTMATEMSQKAASISPPTRESSRLSDIDFEERVAAANILLQCRGKQLKCLFHLLG